MGNLSDKERELLDKEQAERDKREAIAIWGFTNPSPDDNTIKCWYEPTVKKDRQKGQSTSQKLNAQEIDASGDSLSANKRLGLSRSLERENRIFKLKYAIESGRVKTIQDATRLLESGAFIVSKSTIISYLRDLKEQLIDEDTGQKVGFKELDGGISYRINMQDPLIKRRTVYYDGDPALGGKQITKKEHMERMKNED